MLDGFISRVCVGQRHSKKKRILVKANRGALLMATSRPCVRCFHALQILACGRVCPLAHHPTNNASSYQPLRLTHAYCMGWLSGPISEGVVARVVWEFCLCSLCLVQDFPLSGTVLFRLFSQTWVACKLFTSIIEC